MTVWLLGANWNCTISPAFAVMSLGEKVREPLAEPTFTTWTVTISCAVVGISNLPDGIEEKREETYQARCRCSGQREREL